ncbi:MAG: DNA methyltransferase [bacterium]
MPSLEIDPKNRLNDLDSRRWLQFQKSWFYLGAETPAEFIAFFTKEFCHDGQLSTTHSPASSKRSIVGIFPENAATLEPMAKSLGREAIVLEQSLTANSAVALDYVIVDLRKIFQDEESYVRQAPAWLKRLHAAAALMKPNSYLTMFLCNSEAGNRYLPLAWEFGKLVGAFLTMKDEKIGCERGEDRVAADNSTTPSPTAKHIVASGAEVVYCLNFRRDAEITPPLLRFMPTQELHHQQNAGNESSWDERLAWFVVKPPPREKNVLLHPAKFPEPFIQQFIERFTKPGERVFDPMAGTGSALVAAAACNRAAYGIELNPAFCDIIQQRFEARRADLPSAQSWQVCSGDAGVAKTYAKLPASFHYVITSPPYWDMLRMKGAETQQKRKQAGLLQFYSDDKRDLGNMASYEDFLETLVKIYQRVSARLEPGRHMTIIVKNVKKKGQIFPLAWDLSFRLRDDFALCREQFWCQDDQKLAPFGYRYAWVSNTFHHYCLHFQKPLG